MRKVILMLTVIIGTASSSYAQYIDQNFSIKEFKVFVQVSNKAIKGCWTNISETKR